MGLGEFAQLGLARTRGGGSHQAHVHILEDHRLGMQQPLFTAFHALLHFLGATGSAVGFQSSHGHGRS